MLAKIVSTFLVGLQLLLGSTVKTHTSKPTPTPISNTTASSGQENGISIKDAVYADLALQHELNHVSVYYFDNEAADTISIDADKNWDPASTIKLYPAMYAFDQISHGNISSDQLVTIDPKNIAPSQSYGSGYPSLDAGESVTVYRLIDQMITQSDNTAYNTLLDLLDRQQITKYVHDLGLTNSSVGSKLNLNNNQQQYEFTTAGYGANLITASDYAKAFIMINGGRIPGSTDLFDILARQRSNLMIPALLPNNVIVAHKTGELDPDYHDGGIIVDADRRYILSMFSDLGDPGIVAHISDLIYTADVSLIGNNLAGTKSISEVPNAPLDPLVVNSEPLDTSVLAANTTNIKLPKITAADLGIRASDISGSLGSRQLPMVIIPANSSWHFLVDLGEKIRAIYPIPALRAKFEADNLKLTLAEANDLIKRGEKDEANKLLQNVNTAIAGVAQEGAVKNSLALQSAINQVSETRFSILGSELSSSADPNDKLNIIKEVAKQAEDTTLDVKPFVSEGIKTTDLSQTPVVGQVVRTDENSITIKTTDGEVTTQVDSQVTTREAGQEDTMLQSPSQIPIGSTIAVAGSSFVLTNIPSDSAEVKPVTVLKVNEDTNTMVIADSNGVPQQVDLTSQTVIKGVDTSISLDQIKPGDVVVVHGQPIPPTPETTPTPSATTSASTQPGEAPSEVGSGSSGAGTGMGTANTTTPAPFATNQATFTPSPTIASTFLPKPSNATTAPAATKPTAKPATTPPPPPTKTAPVINGTVIQVVGGGSSTTTSATPKPTAVPKK